MEATTFHEIGINSLLALSLRSSLSSHLGRKIALNTIYENPSISALVSALTPNLRTRDASAEATERNTNINSESDLTLRILSNLISEFQTWPEREYIKENGIEQNRKEVVLLTGATGSLGSSLLQNLASNANISKIYTLIRGSDPVTKLRTSFLRRGMDLSTIDTDLRRGREGKIEILNFNMQEPFLGLKEEEYGKLEREVSTIIHAAWKMDFNMPVEGFVDDCLRCELSPPPKSIFN